MNYKKNNKYVHKVIATILAVGTILPTTMAPKITAEEMVSSEEELFLKNFEKMLVEIQLELEEDKETKLIEMLNEDDNDFSKLLKEAVNAQYIGELDLALEKYEELLNMESIAMEYKEILELLKAKVIERTQLDTTKKVEEDTLEKNELNEAQELESESGPVETKEASQEEQPKIQLYSARNTSNTDTAEKMYEAVIQAPNATTAWNAANEYLKAYPSHSKLSEAVNHAAKRVYSMGQSSQRNNKLSDASYYYGLVKDEPVVNSSLRSNALNAFGEVQNVQATQMYNTVIKAPNASAAWKKVSNYIATYPNHSKLPEAVNHAAQRVYSMGRSRQRENDTTNAIYYYSLIKDEVIVEENLRLSATESYNELTGNISEEMKMYNAVFNASNATSAWQLALDYIESYPNHSRLSEAVNHAGQRVYSMGRSRQRENDTTNAMYYYSLLKDELVLNESIRSNALKGFNESMAIQMYERVINAPGASIAWNEAIEFNKKFPSHPKLGEAIDSAGNRVLSMGISNHKEGNFKNALVYYDMLLTENMLVGNLKRTTELVAGKARSNSKLLSETQYLSSVKSASTASQAWSLAVEGIELYPNHASIKAAIDSAGNRVLSMGISNHKKGNFKNALVYYDMLLTQNKLTGNLKKTTEFVARKARSNSKLLSETQYLSNVKSTSTASQAWDLAVEGIGLYPNHTNTKAAIDIAANRNLQLGRSYQRSGNTSQATVYFNRVNQETNISKSVRTLSQVFLNQLQKTHQPVVYIDAGHGGSDPGAVNNRFPNLGEKVLNLNTSLYLQKELEAKGYLVLMSRANDSFIDLTERALDANKEFADIFVSVHYNSMGGNGSAHGIETFIHHTVAGGFGQEARRNRFLLDNPRIDESLRLADEIHAKLIRGTSMYDRGVKGNNFNVLRNTHVPAVLLELGFMDNHTEFSKISKSSYQKDAAKLISDGIEAYFNSVLK